jgi:hypothetical protein
LLGRGFEVPGNHLVEQGLELLVLGTGFTELQRQSRSRWRVRAFLLGYSVPSPRVPGWLLRIQTIRRVTRDPKEPGIQTIASNQTIRRDTRDPSRSRAGSPLRLPGLLNGLAVISYPFLRIRRAKPSSGNRVTNSPANSVSYLTLQAVNK